jgi:hypothetical protein
MDKRSFTGWLKQQDKRRDPVGDLARDVKVDREWPRASTLRGFQSYFDRISASDGAKEALKRAWLEWTNV